MACEMPVIDSTPSGVPAYIAVFEPPWLDIAGILLTAVGFAIAFGPTLSRFVALIAIEDKPSLDDGKRITNWVLCRSHSDGNRSVVASSRQRGGWHCSFPNIVGNRLGFSVASNATKSLWSVALGNRYADCSGYVAGHDAALRLAPNRSRLISGKVGFARFSPKRDMQRACIDVRQVSEANLGLAPYVDRRTDVGPYDCYRAWRNVL
jgi:hypothetical protein